MAVAGEAEWRPSFNTLWQDLDRNSVAAIRLYPIACPVNRVTTGT